jgi:ATP-dependent protease Clp ATPase subunit
MWTFIAESLRPQARKKGTGARGLRSILESVLLEAQYHVSPRRQAFLKECLPPHAHLQSGEHAKVCDPADASALT